MALEERFCPHCKSKLEPWIAPPETGWGKILVCCNNACTHYDGSGADIINKEEESPVGCRYAEDPDNKYNAFNLAAWVGPKGCDCE